MSFPSAGLDLAGGDTDGGQRGQGPGQQGRGRHSVDSLPIGQAEDEELQEG